MKFLTRKLVTHEDLNARGYYNDRIDHSVTLWGYYETFMKKKEGSWKIIKHSFFSIGAEE